MVEHDCAPAGGAGNIGSGCHWLVLKVLHEGDTGKGGECGIGGLQDVGRSLIG